MKHKPYDRQKAVDYAHRWAFGRNPAYYNFDKLGGDCTNFASQVLYSGCGVMNPKPTTGWYYRNLNSRSPSWSGVVFFYRFLVSNKGPGPVVVETGMEKVKPGDILQLSFNGIEFSHSPVIVSVGDVPAPENILIAAHTYDSDYRPLDTYQYRLIRFLHIDRINLW
ncbi:hypothetical protein SDC9_134495 [bioreactor metagenome]|uniref:Putative amidase domain-containing protein n=1 Tax=bioreactor metagenome TaxID=1076179 RepID=A0A645DDS6_9ZZZZ